jgi:predicted NBD/HSP70 family sugar kinase
MQAHYLALDLGATKFASMRSLDGTLGPLRATIIPSLNDAWKEFAHIARFLAEEDHAIRGRPVLCTAPCLDDAGRVISWPNRPHWCGFPLLEQIQLCLRMPISCLGDGEAVALADAQNVEGVVHISLYFGTGIASGMVANAKTLRFGLVNSELGHIVVDSNGPKCVCGKMGCAQAIWRSFIEGDIAQDELAENLARLAVTLSQIFPACVITFGGRLLAVCDDITESIRSAADKMAPPTAWSPKIKRSSFGGNAPLAGALRVAVRGDRLEGA